MAVGVGGKEEQRRWSRILSLSCSSSSGLTAAAAIFVCFVLFAGIPSAASLSFSENQPALSTGRRLLQAQKGCPVNFENLNYTMITSRCKGPSYPPGACCSAFKDFACPYADQLNDQTNNCATTMFSYINLYGKYPPGLFANECRDSKRGLECSSSQSNTQPNSATLLHHTSIFILSVATSFSILWHLRLL